MQTIEARQNLLGHMPWQRRVAEIVEPISSTTRADDMEAWLLARIAEALEADPLAIDPMLPPSVYGFEVTAARALTRELERCLGRTLPENIFDGCRSVRAVAQLLSTTTDRRDALLPMTRAEMRRLLFARAARLPRRPLACPGEGLRPGWAGCSPGERTQEDTTDLALAS